MESTPSQSTQGPSLPSVPPQRPLCSTQSLSAGHGVSATAEMPTEAGAHVDFPPLLQLSVHFFLLKRDSHPASCGAKSDRTITLVSTSHSKKLNMPALCFMQLLLVVMLTLTPITNLK